MNASDSLPEMRTTFRCPVAASRSRCALLTDKETLPARLVDESAGGFAILIDRWIDLEIGQPAQLQTDSGLFMVSVQSIKEALPPEVHEDTDAEVWYRIGLQRLGDVMPADQPSASPFTWGFRHCLRQWLPSNAWFSLTGILLALVAALVPLGLAGMLWYARSAEHGDKTVAADSRASRSRESRGGPFPIRSLSTAVSIARSRNDFSSDGGEQPGETVFHAETDLRELVRRLPGPMSLDLPEVVRKLQLTEKQQALIRQIIDAMAEAMRKLDIDPLLRGAERHRIHQTRNKLFDDYLRQAVKVLTPEQRAEWKKLNAEPSAER